MKKYHFIGIGGIGMSALARLLLQKQMCVTGSDLVKNRQIEKLVAQGAWVAQGHSARHVQKDAIVVYSSDIKPGNPEYEAALSLQCSLMHRSSLLDELTQGYTSLAVTGTHGKTTTSALLTHVLQQAHCDPSFALGGLLKGENSHLGSGQHFVFEADESDGTFEFYHPDYAIFTNLGSDHLNHYGSLEQLQATARRFCERVKHLIYCGDDPYLRTLGKGKSYGFQPDCDTVILQTTLSGFMQTLLLQEKNGERYTLEVPLIGCHHACNVAAVWTLTRQLGLSPESITTAVKTFPGVSRRMEVRGEVHKILQLDDYAHHPTEIQTTLEGLRRAIGERRLVVLFQPHRHTRIAELFPSFVGAFEQVDLLLVTDIYGAGETPGKICAQDLVEAIRKNSTVPCEYISRTQWDKIDTLLRPHDVFLSMGAGDVTTVHDQLSPRAKYKVGLIFGGRSCEHEISVRSSKLVRASLSPELYDIEPFFIDKQGQWSHGEEEAGESLLRHMTRLESCDLFFPILHGTYGEDGTIQGFFEILDKPYVGPDWAACALAMNKMQSKMVAQAQGVHTPHALCFTRRQWQLDKTTWLEKLHTLHLPLFVKPNHLGSSVGISKVLDFYDLEKAIGEALSFDTEVMVEEGVVNAREFEFAVMGNHDGFAITVPNPGEKLAAGEFVTYSLKYSTQPVPTTVTPTCSPEVLEAGREAAYKVYQGVGCSGMTRVDFLLDSKNQWWFFELNSIPGMGSLSLFPKIWQREGKEYNEVIDRLIILALDRTRGRRRYVRPL